jgi:hypothetical protein
MIDTPKTAELNSAARVVIPRHGSQHVKNREQNLSIDGNFPAASGSGSMMSEVLNVSRESGRSRKPTLLILQSKADTWFLLMPFPLLSRPDFQDGSVSFAAWPFC